MVSSNSASSFGYFSFSLNITEAHKHSPLNATAVMVSENTTTISPTTEVQTSSKQWNVVTNDTADGQSKTGMNI